MFNKITACLFILSLYFTGCSWTETPEQTAPANTFLDEEDLDFLKEITRDVVEASRVHEGDMVGEYGPNITGGTLIRPGGRDCYPAFWIRDYAMSLDCGLISAEEQRHMLLLTAKHQPDHEIRLKSGSFIPPGSIPDHIPLQDKPIFFPGTLDDFEGQGGQKWGDIPSLDDAFFFVKMAKVYVDGSLDTKILEEKINGKPLLTRLEDAIAMPPYDPATQLVYATDESRGIAFGFTDTTTHTGFLLVSSLLKYRAALQLADLCGQAGQDGKAKKYLNIADTLKTHIGATFTDDSGLLRASTGKSAQPDIWGSAIAVYFGALDDSLSAKVCIALADCLEKGSIDWKGNIRHVPTDMDFNSETSWEVSLAEKNTYQNGAYWNTPTGWVCHAVFRVNRDLARDLAAAFIQELRTGDFRKGEEYGSPWECQHPNGHQQNPVYMTSVTVPLSVFLNSK
ncbi:MAG: hypothetical protein ABIJ42_07215 [Acidobacteriota bacterium]